LLLVIDNESSEIKKNSKSKINKLMINTKNETNNLNKKIWSKTPK